MHVHSHLYGAMHAASTSLALARTPTHQKTTEQMTLNRKSTYCSSSCTLRELPASSISKIESMLRSSKKCRSRSRAASRRQNIFQTARAELYLSEKAWNPGGGCCSSCALTVYVDLKTGLFRVKLQVVHCQARMLNCKLFTVKLQQFGDQFLPAIPQLLEFLLFFFSSYSN